MRLITVKPAYEWLCSGCGVENFTPSQRRGGDLVLPSVVKCKHCESEYLIEVVSKVPVCD